MRKQLTRSSLLLLFAFLGLTVFAQKVERNLVVVEVATATWCGYCPGAALGVDELVEHNHPVAIIENHSGDAYANEYANARNVINNASGLPTATFDGTSEIVGGHPSSSLYSNYVPKVEERMAVLTPFSIAISGEEAGNNKYKVKVLAKQLENHSYSNLKVVIAVTETNIAQNWQNQTQLHFVNRLMVPNGNGESVSFTNNKFEKEFDVNLDPSWNKSNLEFIAFIQDASSKEILNGVKYHLTDLPQGSPQSVNDIQKENNQLNVFPSPVQDQLNFSFNSKKSTTATISVYDLNGKQVINTEKQIQTGKNLISLNMSSQNTGMYILQVKADQLLMKKKFCVK